MRRSAGEETRAREARKATQMRADALKEAVSKRNGWQYDPRTGDARLILNVLGVSPRPLGGIAYVRPRREGTGYESIFKGDNPAAPRFPGNCETATEQLIMVEKWLQDNLEGRSKDRAEIVAYKAFREFLMHRFGKEEGMELFVEYTEFVLGQ